MERKDQVVLENMCMIQDGSMVLVEDKIGKDIRGIIFPGGHIEKKVNTAVCLEVGNYAERKIYVLI